MSLGRSAKRWLWLCLAYTALALGIIGIFLPLLPTTPFLLLTAALYFRGSPRLYQWLLNHKCLGPYIRNFHSSSYINDLANGDVCLVVGWSGDVFQARDRAAEAGNGVNVAYSIPKEGAPQWFDMLAIPKDAKNVDNAYAFINYLLDPKVAAANTNYVTYPNPVPASKPMVDQAIAEDPTIYPPAEVDAKLFTFAVLPPEVDRQYTRIWTELKTGR